MLAQYVMKRGGQAKVGAVDAVPQEWASPLDVFEQMCIRDRGNPSDHPGPGQRPREGADAKPLALLHGK